MPRGWGGVTGATVPTSGARAVRTSYLWAPRWEASQHGTQDASNLTDAGGNLVLSFGVNDFESRLGNKSTWRKCGACWHRCRAQRRRALHAWRSEAGVV